ncbi:hypothetical protein RJG79_01865 [Mycoplasmatota bacterium WC44]
MILNKYLSIQPNVVKILINSYKNNRFSHAYIFEGNKGTRKLDLAVDTAKMLLCDDECGTCNTCKSIEMGSHPNVTLVEPQGTSIKKDQIKNLITELNKTSLVAGPRVYIINHIDKMTPSAANSLLKYFEEPHDNTYAILITENIQMILPTIISRAQVVTFNKMSNKSVRSELINKGIREDLAVVASLVTNNLDEAIKLCDSEELKNMIEVIYELGNIYANKYHNALIYFHENAKFINRDNVGLFLDLIMYYYKDLINHKVGIELNFPNDKSLRILRDIDSKIVRENLEFIFEQRTNLKYYANVPLMLDRILLKLDWR